MIKAIILDLDDTLLDTTEQLSRPWKQTLLQIIHEKRGISAHKIKSMLKKYRKLYTSGKKIIRALSEEFNLNEERINREIAGRMDLSPLKLSADSKKFIKDTEKYKVFLITTGLKLFQERKLKQVGLKDKFSVLYDESDGGKAPFMKEILKEYKPSEIICIGDNIKNEIPAANSLGIKTIRILKGRRRNLQPENALENPYYTIKKLKEALKIIKAVK